MRTNRTGRRSGYGGRANSADPGPESASKRRPAKPAREKIVDFLAMRDHSERELRQKLKRRYEAAEIDEAMEFARENNLLAPEEVVAERTARALGRKRKGHRFINQYLKHKGLPVVAKDDEEEERKAIELVEARLKLDFTENRKFDFETKKKIQRLLANRGFDLDTIRRVIGR